MKAQIDARMLKAKKEKIRQLVEKTVYIIVFILLYNIVGRKSSRKYYNKNKPWRKLGRKRKEETSTIHNICCEYYCSVSRSRRNKRKSKITAVKTEAKVESIKSSRPPSASSIGKQPSLVFRTSALGGLGSTASLDRPLTPSDSPSEANLAVKPSK